MKKNLKGLVVPFLLFAVSSMAQNSNRAIGVSFFLNDFNTPSKIRASTLSSVINKKLSTKIGDMASGLAITYFKPISDKIDLALEGAASSVKYAANGELPVKDKFLIELSTSAQFNLVPSNYWIQPYVSAGVGASMYGSTYFGAFTPLGLGLKLNFTNTTKLFVNSQYRVPVTEETSAYHLVYQIGISSSLVK